MKPRIEYKDYLVAVTVPDSHQNADIIQDYCKRVIKSLPQMGNGVFHSELFIKGDSLLLCEIASRSAGGGITACIKNSYQLDFYEEWAKSAYMPEYSFPNVKFSKYSASIIVPKNKGVIKKMVTDFPFQWVVQHYWDVKVGDIMDVSKWNGDKMGLIVIEGESYDEIVQHVKQIKEYIEINTVIEAI